MDKRGIQQFQQQENNHFTNSSGVFHVQVGTDTSAQAAYRALAEVYDPEIPTLSVIDLGMVNSVYSREGVIDVSMTPTFLGCPALEIIRHNVQRQLEGRLPGYEVEVMFDVTIPWTTERVTELGQKRLREHGIAAPSCSLSKLTELTATCPYCGSQRTKLENLFGPTACRSMFYCDDCRQPFESMKPV